MSFDNVNNMKRKYVIYTAIFNDYDWLKEPVIPSQNVDYICYTDSSTLKSKHWIIVHVDLNGKSPSLLNREIKLLYPYTELQDYDYSLYIDGSMMLKGEVEVFLYKYCVKDPFLMNFKHPNKDCLFTEIEYCIKRGRGNAEKLVEQRDIYRKDGMPEHYGLSDNKILLRNNHSELGEKIMREWFNHVVSYSGRDQVCLPYVLYKYNQRYSFFDENIENNEFFETWPHNNVVWYIRYWRHFKWFCERNHILDSLINMVDSRIKPRILNQ